MKEEATIYDLFRICRTAKCEHCPLWDDDSNECGVNYSQSNNKKIDKLNEIILKWCKEHPIKTRQDKFLELFPNAKMYENKYVNICPKTIDQTVECKCATKECADCTKSYWLEEVEE